MAAHNKLYGSVTFTCISILELPEELSFDYAGFIQVFGAREFRGQDTAI
jgi:hypothetical protein